MSIIIPKYDENLRFLSCPICGNNKFSEDASYCRKCGFYLYNTCSNFELEFRELCGRPNVSDALYCEYCGSITLIGLTMNEQQEGKKQVAAGSQAFDDKVKIRKQYKFG